MSFAVLRVPDFALQALRRSEPALAGQPVALVAGEGRQAVLTEVSPEAVGPITPKQEPGSIEKLTPASTARPALGGT